MCNKKNIIIIIILVIILIYFFIIQINYKTNKKDIEEIYTEIEKNNKIQNIETQNDETQIMQGDIIESKKVENVVNEIIETNTNKSDSKKVENKVINQVKNKEKTSSFNKDFFINEHLKEYPSFGEKYATLKIDKIGINTPIYFGLNDEMLLKGVCHDSGSYFPGENGSIIMCGHNYMNNFKRLRRTKKR